MIVDLQASIEKAITEYINDGKADLLILNRLAKLKSSNCCKNCKHWNRQVEYCMDYRSEHGTMLPFQTCEFFEPKEVTND